MIPVLGKKFKVGDLLEAVNVTGGTGTKLIKGEIYEVIEVKPYGHNRQILLINTSSGPTEAFADRFIQKRYMDGAEDLNDILDASRVYNMVKRDMARR